MALVNAVTAAGILPNHQADRAAKKRYSEILSNALAEEVADGLRQVGFPNVKPERGGKKEKEFQGGLGSKKVDVSYADERNGLLLAVSIKSICFPPFGKNLKNRFGDLCTEAITLHMRFPYSVVGALFALPETANCDVASGSTFKRATRLFSTISGRGEYTGPGEKFEQVVMMLFQPLLNETTEPWVKLVDTLTDREVSETEYFLSLQKIFNRRNPHMLVGELSEDKDLDEETEDSY